MTFDAPPSVKDVVVVAGDQTKERNNDEQKNIVFTLGRMRKGVMKHIL